MGKHAVHRVFAGIVAAVFLTSVMFTGNLLLGALLICTVMLLGMARAGPQQNSVRTHACATKGAAPTSQLGFWRWLSLFLSTTALGSSGTQRATKFNRYGPGIHFRPQHFNDTGQNIRSTSVTGLSYALDTGQPYTRQSNCYQPQTPARASPVIALLFVNACKTFVRKARRFLQTACHSARYTLHQREPLAAGCH